LKTKAEQVGGQDGEADRIGRRVNTSIYNMISQPLRDPLKFENVGLITKFSALKNIGVIADS
jgi:hypothetical protein